MNRRNFLQQTTALGAASMFGLSPCARAEPPPETTRIRFVHGPWLCYAPQYLAEEFLRMEGFSEIEYQKIEISIPATPIKSADLSIVGAPGLIPVIDSGMPVTTIAGLHVGCWELFGNERVRAIRDLAGKSIAVSSMAGPDGVWIASMLAYVGIHPLRDVNWVATGRITESMRLFVEGKVDAFLGFPPQPQEMRSQSRARDRKHDDGSTMVAVLLLHAGGPTRVRIAKSNGYQARFSCNLKSDGYLRKRT